MMPICKDDKSHVYHRANKGGEGHIESNPFRPLQRVQQNCCGHCSATRPMWKMGQRWKIQIQMRGWSVNGDSWGTSRVDIEPTLHVLSFYKRQLCGNEVFKKVKPKTLPT